MRKVGGRVLVGILIAIIFLAGYTFWDNNRITIAEKEITIDSLPQHLNDFTILQVSDLHEKQFGKDQKKLLKKINSIDYDVIIFTGDMLDNRESTNYQPFYSILEGLDNKSHMLYVPGNADPYSYQIDPTFGKSEFIKGMEERGVTFLESIDTIEVGGKKIHFVNFELSILKDPGFIARTEGVVQPPYAVNKEYLAYQKQLWNDMEVKNTFTDSDIVIALNHYPVVDTRIEFIDDDPHTVWKDFDLIIAGHYHGGQIRLPLLGAFFVPESWYEPNSFFPPKDRVKGLWKYRHTKQYVSTGLGSSDAISFLKFRFLNPPEINVLKLKDKQE